MKKSEVFTGLIAAAEISVIFVSAMFIADILSWSGGFFAALVYILLAAALYVLALISSSKKLWLLKWGVSVPLSFLVLQYFRYTDYMVRSLNWVFPNYGRQSAGGNFAGMLLLAVLSFMCLAGGLTALSMSREDKGSDIRRLIVTSVFTAMIVYGVLVCEAQFPSYESIFAG
ncbi:hypothetical protein [Ruminococcus sp.]|uniref:hypothetical protein n=1 Tax=Ruminococcus sp. TaxID=41978 RepID=UPI0025F0A461|nr:hypothetical protein [Ruminococcus sp.]MBQ8966226.1 hypothetical protein [Ruminococcus sp.]